MQAHSDAGTLKLQDGVDPSTEKAGRTYSGHCADEAREIAGLARVAFDSWRRTSFGERARPMKAADADIDQAAEICAAARMVNAGQSCIAGKRFIVLAEVREAFEQAFAASTQSFEMGDPRQPDTRLGPLQSVKARDPATVLTDVTPGMPAYDEEVFGPVAAIIEARDEADAIRLANTSPFGLGSGVLTRDLARGERIAAEWLEAGISFFNENVRSDPRMPFGGIKDSGYGRECSHFGIREFVNIKSVHVRE